MDRNLLQLKPIQPFHYFIYHAGLHVKFEDPELINILKWRLLMIPTSEFIVYERMKWCYWTVKIIIMLLEKMRHYESMTTKYLVYAYYVARRQRSSISSFHIHNTAQIPWSGKAIFKRVNKHFVAKSFQKELIVNYDSQTHVFARCFMLAEIKK